MNEIINDSSRLVAQSLQLIKDYMDNHYVYKKELLIKAQENLEKALETLASNIG